MTTGGSIPFCRYEYPDRRVEKDAEGRAFGVAGKAKLLCAEQLTSQPVAGFDWSPDKLGLFCCGALDQCVRVGSVTKLNTL